MNTCRLFISCSNIEHLTEIGDPALKKLYQRLEDAIPMDSSVEEEIETLEGLLTKLHSLEQK